ncbi:MAG: hypothetical protein ACKOOL_07275 [Novosphingobium sp.]
MQLRSAHADVNRSVERVEDLHQQLRQVGDNATGCRLSRSLRGSLSDLQIHAEKLAGIYAQLGNDDAHRSAVDMHNAALEERHRLEGGILVKCAELGL